MKLIGLIILHLISLRALANNSYQVGIRDYNFMDQTRHRKIATHVWYPVESKTQIAAQKQKGPFVPVTGALNSPISNLSQKYPVVLLSHGSMGLANRLFWLGEALVQNGFIVIAVDHPGNMFQDSSADGLMRVWDRAKDLSYALDNVSRTSELGSHLDLDHVSAIGHSAGGAAVLLLAGARFSAERFQNPIPLCEGSQDPVYQKECNELKAFNYRAFDKKVVEGDYSDKRVKAIVGLDPGFTRSFDPASLKNLKPKALVFIAEKLEEPQDEIYSKDFLKLLPSGQAEVVKGSVHMTFLQACKEGLPIEDPELKALCSTRDEKLRLQKQVSEKLIQFLGQ